MYGSVVQTLSTPLLTVRLCSFYRCQIDANACNPNPCVRGFECTMADNSIHCERRTSFSYVEIAEICAGILGLFLLVVAFVCLRKRYISHKKHKSACVQDSNDYFPTLSKSTMKETEFSSPMEISTLVGFGGDLDNSPFRSLKQPSQRELGPQVGPRTHRSQGPVICSVAPNLPPPPSSSSDNDSIRKKHWEHDYEGKNARFIFAALFNVEFSKRREKQRRVMWRTDR